MRAQLMSLSLGLLLLTGCEPTLRPDYRIAVMPTPEGMVAIPPECPSWTTEATNPFDGQPVPQFGCAHARNLAIMVEHPEDLIQGRDLGSADANAAANAVGAYRNGQTRGLIDPGKSASQPAVTTATPASASSSSGGTSP